MPYITQSRRAVLDRSTANPQNAGELNYVLTWHMLHTDLSFLPSALDEEIRAFLFRPDDPPNYARFNEVIGALECCRREYARRRAQNTAEDLRREDAIRDTMTIIYNTVVAPYEDTKIEQNGDVY